MMRILLPIVLLLWQDLAAQPPPGYYDAAEGLTGQALRQALNGIISPHTVLPNNALWAAFESTDKKDDGTVWDMYSDVPGGVPAYVYQFVADQCGTYNSEGDCFNREHSFPQSWYNSMAPMSTDLFHLYPTDAWVNQQRANWPFGSVAQPEWTSTNGGKLGPCSWPGCNGTVFEPIDAYKGDFARSYFYMLTRYLPLLPGWNSPMMSDGAFLPWAESLLLAWHLNDPVSTKETERNNAVFVLQGNRNPYIDRPEWVQRIWGPTASVGILVADVVPAWMHEGALYASDEVVAMSPGWRIVDLSGRTVMHGRVTRAITPVPTTLSSGSYLILLELGIRPHAIRFIH